MIRQLSWDLGFMLYLRVLPVFLACGYFCNEPIRTLECISALIWDGSLFVPVEGALVVWLLSQVILTSFESAMITLIFRSFICGCGWMSHLVALVVLSHWISQISGMILAWSHPHQPHSWRLVKHVSSISALHSIGSFFFASCGRCVCCSDHFLADISACLFACLISHIVYSFVSLLHHLQRLQRVLTSF